MTTHHKKSHSILNSLHLTLHPLKTYVGKTAHGFNFLGYFMDNTRILPSKETIRRFHERALVLYEHPTDPLKRIRHRIGRDISEYSVNESRPQEKEVRRILTSLNTRGGIRHKANRRLGTVHRTRDTLGGSRITELTLIYELS